MNSLPALLLPAALALVCGAAIAQATPGAVPPATLTADGKLPLPGDYREWIYLTSGIDMSYNATRTPDHHMFDSVFVQPAAYRVFKATGTWPDGTMLVMESRGASTKGSINQRGFFQTTDLMGVEVHVKDAARFAGGWAFFAFDDDKPTPEIKHDAACYACHQAHAAVDTTFVQFYPTLLPIARANKTFSAAYLASPKAGE